jgi:2-dehydro-3-deoxygluconokinase
VFYNRANEAGPLLKPNDFDWEEILSNGVRWFHNGGIFAALSETTGKLVIEGMQPAKAAGAVTPFTRTTAENCGNVWGRLGSRPVCSQTDRGARGRSGGE